MKLLILVGTFFCVNLFAADQEVKTGLYRGAMILEGGKNSVPVRLHLKKGSRVTDKTSEAFVFLRVNLGNEHSAEYISYFFYKPEFEWAKPLLTLAYNNNIYSSRDFALRDGTFSGDNLNKLEGDFVIVNSTKLKSRLHETIKGKLILWHESSPYLEARIADITQLPPIATLTGTYRGACNGKKYLLQFAATKATGFQTHFGDPMPGYVIRGRKTELHKKGHIGRISPFAKASYDIYSGRLQFTIEHNTTCRIESRPNRTKNQKDRRKWVSTIVCGSQCSFAKDPIHGESLANIVENPKRFQHKGPVASLPKPDFGDSENYTRSNATAEAEGSYIGYIFNEARKIFEPIELKPSFELTATTCRVSMINNVFAGLPGSLKAKNIPFTYALEDLPEKPDEGMSFLGKEDSVLFVDRWCKAGMHGTVYSKTFGGYVGPFVAYRDPNALTKAMGKTATIAAPISGPFRFHHRYGALEKFGIRSIDLDVVLDISTTKASKASYYPFEFQGRFLFDAKIALGTREHLERLTINLKEGRFDPFTGVMGLDFEQNIFVGGAVWGSVLFAYQSPAKSWLEFKDRQNLRIFRPDSP